MLGLRGCTVVEEAVVRAQANQGVVAACRDDGLPGGDGTPEEITPYERSPRRSGKAVAKVAASIKAYGFRQPIVVDGDGVIVVGSTRAGRQRSGWGWSW